MMTIAKEFPIDQWLDGGKTNYIHKKSNRCIDAECQ